MYLAVKESEENAALLLRSQGWGEATWSMGKPKKQGSVAHSEAFQRLNFLHQAAYHLASQLTKEEYRQLTKLLKNASKSVYCTGTQSNSIKNSKETRA